MNCPECGKELYIAGILKWYCSQCVKEFWESECNKKKEELHHE